MIIYSLVLHILDNLLACFLTAHPHLHQRCTLLILHILICTEDWCAWLYCTSLLVLGRGDYSTPKPQLIKEMTCSQCCLCLQHKTFVLGQYFTGLTHFFSAIIHRAWTFLWLQLSKLHWLSITHKFCAMVKLHDSIAAITSKVQLSATKEHSVVLNISMMLISVKDTFRLRVILVNFFP